MREDKKLSLMFFGTLLSVCYVLGGYVFMNYDVSTRWIKWIITLCGPIGFTLLGYFSKTDDANKERLLVWASSGLTAYVCSLPFLSLIESLPEPHVATILSAAVILLGFFMGAVIGGLNLGLYWRLAYDE